MLRKGDKLISNDDDWVKNNDSSEAKGPECDEIVTIRDIGIVWSDYYQRFETIVLFEEYPGEIGNEKDYFHILNFFPVSD